MSPRELSLLTVLVTGLLVSTGQYFARQDRQQEAARLRLANEQLRLKIGHQRQAQLDEAARSNVNAVTESALASPQSTKNLVDEPTLISPVSARLVKPTYRNDGLATPGATLQTLAWACDQGDMATMEKLQVFDPPAREKAMQFFPSLPPEIRAQWCCASAQAWWTR